MAADIETKKNIRENWLISILCLADMDLQKERWLDRRITNPAWSFIEFYNSYFDVISSSYEDLVAAGFFTNDEYMAVKDFHEALAAYQEPEDAVDHDSILADEDWQSVVALGHRSVERLKDIITQPEEQALFERSRYAPDLTEADFS